MKKSNTLYLNVTRQWFDMISRGEKLEEYRDITPYWSTRIEKIAQKSGYRAITFRNGYAKNAPTMLVDLLNTKKGIGKKEWGATEKEQFILELGHVQLIMF